MQVKAPDVIEIDGAKTPELLPGYVVWQNVLSGLSMIHDKKVTAALESPSRVDAGRQTHGGGYRSGSENRHS